MKKTIKPFSVRVAMTLLTVLMTFVGAQTAWADDPNLGLITTAATVDGGQATNWASGEGPGSLVDGNLNTKYGLGKNDPWVEFHYASAITPKGYVLWTADDSDGTRNPRSWTIKAKNSGDAGWTTLATVDNTSGDKLPMANNTRTVFALNNSTAYTHFRFEATRASNGGFQLAELQFCTVSPASFFEYATISGVEPSYPYTGSNISITPVVRTANGSALTLGIHYTATLNGNNVTSFPFSVKNTGLYTLTVTGKGNYSGSITQTFAVEIPIISQVPNVDDGQATNWASGEGPGSLVDGNLNTKYGLSGSDPWVEFHYASAITPKGYYLWTAGDSEGTRNPRSWTIKARKSGDASWTTLATVDNTSGDRLPMANNARALFALNNSTAYTDFRFEATRASNGGFQLAELQFCTVSPASFLEYATIRGVEPWYRYNGSPVSVTPIVIASDNTELTLGTHFTATLNGSNVTTFPLSLDEGDYTLTVTGKGGYSGSKTVSFIVVTCPEALTIDTDYSKGDAGFYYMKMARSVGNRISKEVTLDGSVRSFKIYDHAGKDGDYGTDQNSELYLTVPEGCRIQLTGSVTTKSSGSDYLNVYDCRMTDFINDPRILWAKGSVTDIDIISTGNVITLHFKSDQWTPKASGIDLTATIIDPDPTEIPYAIISDRKDIYRWNNGSAVTISYNVADTHGNPLTKGTHYTETIRDSNGETVATVTAVGDYTLTIEGIAPYTGSQTFNFSVRNFFVSLSTDSDYGEGEVGHYYINMPEKGTAESIDKAAELTLDGTVTSFKLYDDGGKDGNYSSHYDGFLIINAPTGYLLQLTGSIDMLDRYDELNIYDGNNLSATQLVKDMNGTVDPITAVTTSGNAMTIYFYSYLEEKPSGLDLTVTLLNVNDSRAVSIASVSGGAVTASVNSQNVTSAKLNETVTLAATPDANYALNELRVVDAVGNNVPVVWDVWSNTATFQMPINAVTVTPAFDDFASLSVNMSATGTKTVSVPAGVTSFKVYDDGGPEGDYSRGNSYLVINVPSGHYLQVAGNVAVGSGDDYLRVYDGAYDGSGDAPAYLGNNRYGTYNGENIGMLLSTGTAVTLYFRHQSPYNAGLNLTVTVVDPSALCAVNVATVTGGSVTPSPATAIPGTEVTLTAEPATGHLLSNLSVADANGDGVPMDWSVWTNTATFQMPGTAVTVTPTFTDDLSAAGGLYVNMPATGTKTVPIPTGVQSFKVYDDGGSDYIYSANCDGYLVVTAPEGNILQLTGTVKTSSGDNLVVYNGTEATDANRLGYNSYGYGTEYVGPLISNGRTMMLYFHSDQFVSDSGLDLTVTLLSARDLQYASINDLQTGYKWNGGNAVDITYAVADGNGNPLTKGTHYTETFTNSDNETVATVTAKGDYTLTIEGKGDYSGSQTLTFTVYDEQTGIPVSSTMSRMTSGVYYLPGDVTVSDRITIVGDVTLNLSEGTTLTAQKGIGVESGNSLTVNGPGTLTATGDSYNAGIGGTSGSKNNSSTHGHIIINGGTIDVLGGWHAAGIGGGINGKADENTIIEIYGGIINATGGDCGAGIGGGLYGVCEDIIIIKGGQVHAVGNYAAGIGRGDEATGSGGTLTLGWTNESDFIDASSFDIGSVSIVEGKQLAYDCTPSVRVTTENIAGVKMVPLTDPSKAVDGNVVTSATTGMTAGDYYVAEKNTTILYNPHENFKATGDTRLILCEGVTLNADDRIFVRGNMELILNEGSTFNANVGIGVNSGYTLTINGTGTLNAKGNTYNAGIGGTSVNVGAGAYGETNAQMILYSTHGHITINSGTINAQGGDGAAGIGGGNNSKTDENSIVEINGGVVNATAGIRAAGIGGGCNNAQGGKGGTIIINGGQVTARSANEPRFVSYGIGNGSKNGWTTGGDGSTLTIGMTGENDFIDADTYLLGNVTFTTTKGLYADGTKIKVLSSSSRFFEGDGTQEHPYRVYSDADWSTVGVLAMVGATGNYVKQFADFSTSRRISTFDMPFTGTYDGDGHTITVNYETAENYDSPFRSVKNATIINLRVKGTIVAAHQKIGGLVGYLQGSSNRIEQCWSRVFIKSTYSGEDNSEAYISGFVGCMWMNDFLTIRDCLFDGKLLNGSGSATDGSGFVAESYNDATVQNCLFAPGELVEGETWIGYDDNKKSKDFADRMTTVQNCYYTRTYNNNAGSAAVGDMTSAQLAAALGSNWVAGDGKVVPSSKFPIYYYITYHLNGSTNNDSNPDEFTVESPAITLAVPTTAPEGYDTFKGWYDNSAGTGNAITGLAHGSTGDRSLWAKWTPTIYHVTYHLDGGTNDANNPTEFTIESETITLAAPTKTDYSFEGWYDNKDLTGDAVTTIAAGSTGERELWAKWKLVQPTSIDITMNGAGIMSYSSAWPMNLSDMTKDEGTQLKAYIVNGYNPETHAIILTPVTDIPARTGLLLKGTAGKKFTVGVKKTAMVLSNLLVAVTSAETIVPQTNGNKTNYILANGSYGIDWYTLSQDGSIGANKAYLQLPTSANSARPLTWIYADETTSLREISNEELEISNYDYYTLDGRRIANGQKPTAKGLYIVNGKKVVIK